MDLRGIDELLQTALDEICRARELRIQSKQLLTNAESSRRRQESYRSSPSSSKIQQQNEVAPRANRRGREGTATTRTLREASDVPPVVPIMPIRHCCLTIQRGGDGAHKVRSRICLDHITHSADAHSCIPDITIAILGDKQNL